MLQAAVAGVGMGGLSLETSKSVFANPLHSTSRCPSSLTNSPSQFSGMIRCSYTSSPQPSASRASAFFSFSVRPELVLMGFSGARKIALNLVQCGPKAHFDSLCYEGLGFDVGRLHSLLLPFDEPLVKV